MEKLKFSFLNYSGKSKEVNDLESQEFISNFHLASDFQAVYGSEAYCAFASIYFEDNPKEVLMTLLFRSFLDLSPGQADIRKYVMLCRFSKFGSLAVVDLVSFKGFSYHRNMAYQHLQKVGWFPAEKKFSADTLKETINSPFLIAGGYLEATRRGLGFFDESRDYGNLILGGNVNDLAALLASFRGLDKAVAADSGEKILLQLASALKEFFGKADFYEELCRHLLKAKTVNSFIGVPLLLMKALDRANDEGKDFSQIVAEEVSIGFARNLMLPEISNMLSLKNN